LFGDGSKATIFDISEWNLKDVNLFVLSACQTGLGTSANGAEILGFGYQVQRAGAKASIASLWEVSDGGTQLLMQAFYSQIKQGNISTSEALRQAQIAMINSDRKVEGSDRTGIKIVGTLPNNPDGKLSHPYYWSAFILIGNGL
jgi:CHAT domain-containing protein